ncbi:hypothetical protein EDB92DRAFT_1070186 [Lactarius akahatsu]|uniref:Uncharacterized protein n=1 Tax=Lactarius akahatsu TaxID=416441 RepID=A0AAD4LHT7_9AGAM|nr:hypothetical protein EDB92DRAFT_1070186 [Lactarius akahatsu]
MARRPYSTGAVLRPHHLVVEIITYGPVLSGPGVRATCATTRHRLGLVGGMYPYIDLVLITFGCCYGMSPHVVTNPLLSPVLGPLSSETLTEGVQTTAPIPRALTIPQSPPESVLSRPSVFPSGTSSQVAMDILLSIICTFLPYLVFHGHIRDFENTCHFTSAGPPAAPDVVCNS